MRKRYYIFTFIMLLCMIFAPVSVQAKTTRYTVKYNATGGKSAPKKQTKKSKKKKVSIKLSKKIPSKKGYSFQKWNTKKNGKGKSYNPGSKIQMKRGKKSVTLYAVWKKQASKTSAKPAKQTDGKQNDESKADGADADTKSPAVKSDSKLEVHFLDVGQGDCTLIGCDGEWMLIDAGDNSKGTAVQSYLTSKGVKILKYAIGTHPDADHIGGLDVVITKFAVQNLFMPSLSKDTRTYDDVIQAAKYKSLKVQQPKSGDVYALGGAKFQIVSLNKDYKDNTNNWSICIRLEHGKNSFLFVGDAETDAEADMLKTKYTLKSDVYKVAHHGSRTGSIKKFVNAVSPTYAVISCGAGNSYGHPHAEVMNRLRSKGIKVLRTDEQGTIVAVSNGSTISWNTSPSTSWLAGEPKGSSTSGKVSVSSYVLNENTKVFHLPDCTSVKSMSAKNKKEVTANKSTLIAEGYKACGKCKP